MPPDNSTISTRLAGLVAATAPEMPVVRGLPRRHVRAHWCVSAGVAAFAATLYGSFILLVLFGKPLAGRILLPGLSLELLLAIASMTMAWLATGLYSLWSDRIGARIGASLAPASDDASGQPCTESAP
jgi:uncharacterized membrane protein (DUF485 family)